MTAPARFLFVDDDELARECALAYLTTPDTHVTVAVDGRDGLAALAVEQFDLMLLDLEMPRMDGYAVLEKLRADPATADLPVLVVTSRRDDWALDEVYARGADGFCCKPIDWRLLRQQARFLLRGRAKASERAAA